MWLYCKIYCIVFQGRHTQRKPVQSTYKNTISFQQLMSRKMQNKADIRNIAVITNSKVRSISSQVMCNVLFCNLPALSHCTVLKVDGEV